MLARGYIFGMATLLVLTAGLTAAEVRGTIAKVDPNKKELLLQIRSRNARGQILQLACKEDTRIFFGRDSGTLADLTVGARVRVIYDETARPSAALVINVRGAKPARPSLPGATFGIAQRVALTERELVLIQRGADGAETETSFSVPENAKITRQDKAITLDNIKEGEQIAVVAEKRDGKQVAVSIQVGVPSNPSKNQVPTVSRIRTLLKLADRLLQIAERQQSQKP